jgi:hypothetical protein
MKADKPTLIAYTVKEGHGPEAKAIWPALGRHGRTARVAAIRIDWRRCRLDGRLVLVAPLIEAQATAQG